MTSKGESEPVTFALTKGKTAELTVTTPAMKPAVAKTKEEAAAEATQEAMCCDADQRFAQALDQLTRQGSLRPLSGRLPWPASGLT